jgi:hypothetical protein
VPFSAPLEPNDRTSLTRPSASRLDQRRLDTALLYLPLASSERIIPDYADNKTPRPNRYIMLDFIEPVAGVSDSAFEAVLSKRVIEVLALSGWMAAQPFHFAKPPPSARPTSLAFTKYLVIWETEGSHAQELQNTLIAATKAGEVKALAADPATAQSSWWVTTSPFITKDDFQR